MNYIKTGCILPSEFKKIEKEMQMYRMKAAESGLSNSHKSGYIDNSVRKSLTYFPNPLEARHTHNLIQSLIIQEYAGSGLDVSNVSEVQYVRYEVGGKFTWHSDDLRANRPDQRRRGLTFSINMSPANNYTGGELRLRCNGDEMQLSRKQGSYIVFPSQLKHQVDEVTMGVREAIVMWVYLTDEEKLTLV